LNLKEKASERQVAIAEKITRERRPLHDTISWRPSNLPEGDWIVYVLSSVNANENRYESSLFGVKALEETLSA
jgi:hypothetical protein